MSAPTLGLQRPCTPKDQQRLPVNVVHEIDQNDEGHNQHVDLALQLLLNDQFLLGKLAKVHDLTVGDVKLLADQLVVGHVF
jgi:hypothetical protein